MVDQSIKKLPPLPSPLPHLLNSNDWKTWKESMLTMRPQMKEHSQILALYMHCMLQ